MNHKTLYRTLISSFFGVVKRISILKIKETYDRIWIDRKDIIMDN